MKKLFIIIAIIIFVMAMIFSIYKFRVLNPISSCFGMLQILLTDKEYVVVQKMPYKVIFTKPGLFEKYMTTQGFFEVKEKQMGADHVYSNGTKEEKVYTRTNAYYMIGVFD